MTVLEARDRVGGRVEQIRIDDGRPVQLGGEVVGLGAHVLPGARRGARPDAWSRATSRRRPDDLRPARRDRAGRVSWPFRQRRGARRLRAGRRASTASSSRPSIPAIRGRIRTPTRLDALSFGQWLRSVNALPAVVRALEVGLARARRRLDRAHLAASPSSARLRPSGSAASTPTTSGSRSRWWREARRWRSGSPPVSASGCGSARRSGAIDVTTSGCRVRLGSGEELDAEAVISRAPRRRAARDRDRGRLRGAARVASPPAERPRGEGRRGLRPTRCGATSDANGLSEGEHLLASTWPQRDGVLSGLVPPERLGLLLAVAGGRSRGSDPRRARAHLRRRMARRRSDLHLRLWGTDPYTRGYVTHWWPGDVLRVGPLHGTHAPPFYVCGSDQWVAGYMEGAVRTGRAAAAAALGARSARTATCRVPRSRVASFTPRRASSRAPARWRASPSSPPRVTRCPTLPLSG